MNLAAYLMQKQGSMAPPPSTKEALAQASQALMFDFLLRAGGAMAHPIARQEQIQSLRLWDLRGESQLQLGPRSSHLLQCLQDAFSKDQRIRLPAPAHDNGDIFFYHALYLHVSSLSKFPRFATALRRASPLTRLCYCPVLGNHTITQWDDGQRGEPALTQEEAQHIAQHPATSFLVGTIADCWSEIEPPDAQKPAETQVERINAKRATLQLFLQTCFQLGRLSIATSFPLFFLRLMQRFYVQQSVQMMQFSSWRMANREELLMAYTGLLQLGEQLDHWVQTEIIQPGAYGWSFPLETRIFLQRHGKLWTSGGLSVQIAEAQRQLRSQMG